MPLTELLMLNLPVVQSLGPYVTGAIAAVVVYLVLGNSTNRKLSRVPPGPKPLPLIGNLFDLPTKHEWLTFQSYIERYGDLVYLSVFGQKILLLGSHEAVVDIVQKRPHFNDRPHSIMLDDLMDLGWPLPFLPDGERWRQSRKLFYMHTHAAAATSYQPHQLRGARRLVCDLLAVENMRPIDKLGDEAKAVLPHMVQTSLGLTAMEIVYGIRIRGADMRAKYLDVPEIVDHALSEASTPGRFLVDLIPFLKYIPSWVPGAHFQRHANRMATLSREMRDDAFDAMEKQTIFEAEVPPMAAQMLQKAPNDEQLVKDVAGTFYLAANDTTVAAVTSFFLAVLVYPEVQMRAQEELDRVVGRGRLPEYSDKDQLPYLNGVMRECLRWLPVIPFGVPHMTARDDEYRGYFIPKGTMAFPLHWSLLHNPHTFSDPSTFSPERYLMKHYDGTWCLRPDAPDSRDYVFGFGKRTCPGRHIAQQSLFAALATVLHTLNIVRAKDVEGNEVIPKVQVNSGALSHAQPFAYEVIMRTDAQTLVDVCALEVEGLDDQPSTSETVQTKYGC